METEAVGVTDVVEGDIIRDPLGADVWRQVVRIGEPVSEVKPDGSGEYWTAYYFEGPIVKPILDYDPVGNVVAGWDRFTFRDDQRVVRLRKT
ncbi:hypothetical protein F5X71_03580 [Nocardia brasiliensis]|uniref:Uncharacterized protein n=1 Tax=Nocardia brasiliensis TaxID=37326 RepID=A0A6G9XKS4_NOCBR|nr:hypothetical protein [Nocardia brasiliensis]QIS01515.1 hypothetical protein F5X71_03580 [Nocardia brasiliensis]